MSAKRSLPESDRLFREAFACSRNGMGLADREGRFIRVNPSFCEMVGYSDAELRGLNIRDITHPADLEITFGNVDRLYRGEVSSYQTEKRYLHKNGSVVWAILAVSLVRNGAGDPVCMTGQLQNVTALKEEEEKLTNELVQEAFRTGLGSDVFRSEAGTHLLKVVRALCQRSSLLKTKLSEVAVARMIEDSEPNDAQQRNDRLTKREEETLRLLALGKNNKQVATVLGISARTVEAHRAAMMRKLGADSLADLVRYAIRTGLIKP